MSLLKLVALRYVRSYVHMSQLTDSHGLELHLTIEFLVEVLHIEVGCTVGLGGEEDPGTSSMLE